MTITEFDDPSSSPRPGIADAACGSTDPREAAV